ncbi:hypothetical protein ACQP2F_19500 [Actinoplanes sp. CA-030573]|uniref:hypothetical protein n=1 Tax=Actinoplanes sp. CA-030573 TaxID=3239898 RepID=UPI003D9157B5
MSPTVRRNGVGATPHLAPPRRKTLTSLVEIAITLVHIQGATERPADDIDAGGTYIGRHRGGR